MTMIDVISLVFSLCAAGFSVFTYWSNIVHDRKQATLEAYNQLQEQALDKLYVYMPKHLKEIVRNRRTEEYKLLSSYVARVEHFAVGVNKKIYDLDTVYELSHGFLDGGIRTRIEILIGRKDEDFDEEFYQNVKLLYKKMDNRTKRIKKK
jgi:hypothetical protein